MSDPLAIISLQQDTPELARAYETFGVIQFNHGRLLIEPLALQPGEHVLDIGTGTGRLAELAARLVGPDGSVVGIDPLESRIEIARLRRSANLSFDTGQAEDLARFADASFDVVYLNSVLHWIADKVPVLEESYRVLRPGGRIGLTVQDPTAPHESRVLLRQAIAKAGLDTPGLDTPSLDTSASDTPDPDTRRLRSHGVHAVTDGQLGTLFEDAGFVAYHSELRTLVETHGSADELLSWSESSAFGNFLDGFTYAERKRIRAAFAELVEAKRTAEGLRLARYLRYAFARKPAYPVT